MGGLYCSSRFQPRTRYLWLFANFIVVLITQLLGTVGYFMMSPSPIPTRNVFYALLTSNVVILAVFATPCLTYYFKSNIEQVLTLPEEQFFANAPSDSTQIRLAKINVNKVIMWLVGSVSVFILVHPLFQFFSEDPDTLNDLDYNVFPHIWLGSVQTPLQYYMIFSIHFVGAALTLVSFITFSIYVYFVGHEFCVAFSTLRNFISDFSARAKRNLENASKCEINGETPPKTTSANDEFEDYEKARAANREELLAGLIIAIKAHQVLYKKMKIIKPHIEFLFSAVLLFLIGDQCFFIYLMCSIDMDSFLKTKEILGILHINVILFTYCHAGKLMDDAANMISTELSEIPWYNLTAKHRRTYHIFICQAQKIMRFHAFGVYTMNMPIVLQNLRNIFSLYNILRQVLNN